MLVPESLLGQVGGPNGKGKWSEVIPMPIVSVASANLPNGKILTWSAYDRFRFGGNNGKTYTVIFDPATNQAQEFLIDDTGHDMFCPGTANLADGRIMVTGGSSSPKTSIYDPFDGPNGKWTSSSNMNIPRGYHAMTTLADGNVYTVGGSWSGGRGNKHTEIWDRNTGTWTVKSGIPVDVIGGTATDYHAWLWQAPNGKLFHAGPTREMHWIDYKSQNGSYTRAATRAADDHGFSGTTVMYDTGKLLKAGGATGFSNGAVANGITTIIDINGNNVQQKRVGNMKIPRALHNAVVLPNGEVFVAGGLRTARYFSDVDSRLTPEIWNPETEQWRTLAPMQIPRNYHSIGILLPDGRVMFAGGGLCGSCTENHPDAEIYSPPYLFKSNGQLASRPTITSAPARARQSTNIVVNTNRAISSFSIVRYNSNTHGTNNEQRRVQLQATRIGNNQYRLSIPNPNIATPGYYMLFAMDNAGVPSVAHNIMLDTTVPPPANGNGTGLLATYFNNANFTAQVLQRTDAQINFNWGSGSPDAKIGANTFSVRWEGEVLPRYTEEYTFRTTSDDGVRLWVDGKLIVDKWVNQPPRTYSGKVRLQAGKKVKIRMDYYENGGGAVAKLEWQSANQNREVVPKSQLFPKSIATPPGNGTGLLATYFNNANFTAQVFQRTDKLINFNWGSGSPDSRIGVNTFSVRWEGEILPRYNEDYTFHTTSDDGVKLWVDGKLIINKWIDQPPRTHSGRVKLTAGKKVKIRLDYYENGGGAVAKLEWQSKNQKKQIVPTSQLFPKSTSAPQPSNFFAHWKLDNDAKDAIGNAHGSLKGGAKLLNDAERGKVLSIEREGQHVAVAAKPQLQLGMNNKDFSVAFWMNPKQGKTGRWRAIMHKGKSNRERTFAMWMRPQDNRIHFRISTTASWNEGGDSKAAVAINKWTHVAYVKEGNKLKLYLNGKLDRTITLRGKTVSNNGNLYIGDDPWHKSVLGKMDDVRLYGRAIKASEVSNLAKPPVTSSCPGTGTISASFWDNVAGNNISQIPLNRTPSANRTLNLFEIPANVNDNYAARIRGYICPPITGNYTFWIASDNFGALYLSTDATAAKKKRIAYVNGWTGSREYGKFPSQKSANIRLVAGRKYYVEALMKEGSGGDNLSVAWKMPNGSYERPISGKHLLPYVAAESCRFTQLNGRALDIGSGAGKTFVVGTNRRLYQRSGNNWAVLPAGVATNRVDVSRWGTPWVTSTTNGIHYFKNNKWTRTTGAAKDVGAGGAVYVVGMDNRIYRWNGSGWNALPGSVRAKRVDVFSDNNPWIVATDGFVYQYSGGRWLKKGNFKARDISMAESGTHIWALAASDGSVHKYEGNGVWKKVPGAADHISVDKDGTVWVVNSGRIIYRRDCMQAMTVSPQSSFVSVDDLGDESTLNLQVYPNPVSSILTLDWEGSTIVPDSYEVQILDVSGKTLLSTRLQAEIGNVDMSQFANGMYLVKVKAGDTQKLLRVMKVE